MQDVHVCDCCSEGPLNVFLLRIYGSNVRTHDLREEEPYLLWGVFVRVCVCMCVCMRLSRGGDFNRKVVGPAAAVRMNLH